MGPRAAVHLRLHLPTKRGMDVIRLEPRGADRPVNPLAEVTHPTVVTAHPEGAVHRTAPPLARHRVVAQRMALMMNSLPRNAKVIK